MTAVIVCAQMALQDLGLPPSRKSQKYIAWIFSNSPIQHFLELFRNPDDALVALADAVRQVLEVAQSGPSFYGLWAARIRRLIFTSELSSSSGPPASPGGSPGNLPGTGDLCSRYATPPGRRFSFEKDDLLFSPAHALRLNGENGNNTPGSIGNKRENA